MAASPPYPVFCSFSLSFFHSCLLSFQSTLGPLTLTSSVIWHFCFIALFSSFLGGDCTQSLTDKHRGIYHRLSNLHDPSQKTLLLLRLQMKTHRPGPESLIPTSIFSPLLLEGAVAKINVAGNVSRCRLPIGQNCTCCVNLLCLSGNIWSRTEG